LSTRQPDAPFSHFGIVSAREFLDESVRTGLAGSLHQFGVRRAGFPVPDIFRHCPGEQKHVLLDDADRAAQRGEPDVPHVDPVDAHAARFHIVDAGDQGALGGVACAGGSHQRDGFACPDFQVEIGQHRARGPLVPEGDLVKPDVPSCDLEIARVGAVHDVRLLRHHVLEPDEPRHAVLVGERGVHQPHDRVGQTPDVQQKGDQVGQIQGLPGDRERSEHRHRPGEEPDQRFDSGRVVGLVPVDRATAFEKEPAGLSEPLSFERFVGERLHRTDPAQRVFRPVVDLGDPLPGQPALCASVR
jgi:hypothetical protein